MLQCVNNIFQALEVTKLCMVFVFDFFWKYLVYNNASLFVFDSEAITDLN